VVKNRTGKEEEENEKKAFPHSPVVDLKNGQARVLGQLFLLVLRRVRMLREKRRNTELKTI